MKKKIGNIIVSGVGLMSGSVATAKIGAIGGAPVAGVANNIQSAYGVASTANIVQGASIVTDSLKTLSKSTRRKYK